MASQRVTLTLSVPKLKELSRELMSLAMSKEEEHEFRIEALHGVIRGSKSIADDGLAFITSETTDE